MDSFGDFYNVERIGRKESEFGIEAAKEDILAICDFNYLRDNEEIEKIGNIEDEEEPNL